jgi:HSP20 family molecular chaperone IbpA
MVARLPGYLTIRAERSRTVEGKHRSEFRYGSLTRTLGLPPGADTDGVTAQYDAGILTVTVSLKGEQLAEAVKKVRVTRAGK